MSSLILSLSLCSQILHRGQVLPVREQNPVRERLRGETGFCKHGGTSAIDRDAGAHQEASDSSSTTGNKTRLLLSFKTLFDTTVTRHGRRLRLRPAIYIIFWNTGWHPLTSDTAINALRSIFPRIHRKYVCWPCKRIAFPRDWQSSLSERISSERRDYDHRIFRKVQNSLRRNPLRWVKVAGRSSWPSWQQRTPPGASAMLYRPAIILRVRISRVLIN